MAFTCLTLTKNVRGQRQHIVMKIKQLQSTLHNQVCLSPLLLALAHSTRCQILTRDLKGLTEAQLKEYRDSFKHFDKDNSNQVR